MKAEKVPSQNAWRRANEPGCGELGGGRLREGQLHWGGSLFGQGFGCGRRQVALDGCRRLE
jgi:hypothetical protein